MDQEAPYKCNTQTQISGKGLASDQLRSQSQLEHEPHSDDKPCLTFKVKIIIGVIILLVALGVGLGVGIHFKLLSEVQIQAVGPVTMVGAGANEYVKMQTLEITEKNLIFDNVKAKVMVTQALQKTSTTDSRLLQNESNQTLEVSYYNIHSILDGTGIQLTFDPDGKFSPKVNPIELAKYIMEKYKTANTGTQNQIDGNYTSANFTKDMNEIFSEAFGNKQKFNFSMAQTFNLKLNNQTESFQLQQFQKYEPQPQQDPSQYYYYQDTYDSSQDFRRRRLFISTAFTWVKDNRQNIIKQLKTIALPVFNVVRKWGPQIGCYAGKILYGKIGCNIGKAIGYAGKFLIDTCIPRDVLEVKCTAQDVVNAVKNKTLGTLITVKNTTTQIFNKMESFFDKAVDSTKKVIFNVKEAIKKKVSEPQSVSANSTSAPSSPSVAIEYMMVSTPIPTKETILQTTNTTTYDSSNPKSNAWNSRLARGYILVILVVLLSLFMM